MLALILGFKREKDWEKFEKEIADAMQRFTAMEIGHVEGLDPEGFEQKILQHPDMTLDQKKIMANLLFEKLSYSLETGDTENASKLKAKCLALYRHIRNNFSEHEFDLNVHYRLEFLNMLGEE